SIIQENCQLVLEILCLRFTKKHWSCHEQCCSSSSDNKKKRRGFRSFYGLYKYNLDSALGWRRGKKKTRKNMGKGLQLEIKGIL
ncbi:hypothetical protein NO391_25190, partial [Escherichia coli]|nr:hypothetical protein [Escherichia coli]